MKASELRIGNLVSYHENISIVHGITDPDYGNGIHIHYEHTCIGCEHELIEPIPITEEWLVKFGFNTEDGKLYISPNGYAFTLQKNGVVKFMGLIFRKNMKYVHQLQNLYFALTGKELTI